MGFTHILLILFSPYFGIDRILYSRQNPKPLIPKSTLPKTWQMLPFIAYL